MGNEQQNRKIDKTKTPSDF